MKLLLVCIFSCVVNLAMAQYHTFPFGKVSHAELEMKTFSADTSASALVMHEFGDSYVNSEGLLVFEYHTKIKILKKSGLDEGSVEVPLYKSDRDDREERLKSFKASTFNLENGRIAESSFAFKGIISEKVNKNWNVKKMVLQNVKIGSIIEILYEIETPFFFNFREWTFQGQHPKLKSEYMASIPAMYVYNITLKGYLPLKRNESSILKDCFVYGSAKADCGRYFWSMENIPAFVEEDYMTASRNFIASINFELSEVRHFDGHKDRYTKEWKDAEDELRTEERFGLQIKRGKDVVDEQIEATILAEQDPLLKAQKIYDFMQAWYQWNEKFGIFSLGVKKAFTTKTGSVADINLSLISALKYAGLSVEPVILSTRENGSPIEIHPVLSDFNYVVAKLNVDGKVYLLDATDDFLPFGLLPQRCLNGKGRVLGEKESYWYDLKPAERAKEIVIASLKLSDEGAIAGTITRTSMGYAAADKRKAIYRLNGYEEYIEVKNSKSHTLVIQKSSVDNENELKKPLNEKWEVALEGSSMGQAGMILDPFFATRWDKNPFKSAERLYPVDFGVPLEQTYILNLDLPEGHEVVELPNKTALALPNNGGRFIYEMKVANNRLTLNSSLVITRIVYTPDEYHYLRELFNSVVSAQNAEIIIRKKDSTLVADWLN